MSDPLLIIPALLTRIFILLKLDKHYLSYSQLPYDLEKEYTSPWGKIYIVFAWKFLLFSQDYLNI